MGCLYVPVWFVMEQIYACDPIIPTKSKNICYAYIHGTSYTTHTALGFDTIIILSVPNLQRIPNSIRNIKNIYLETNRCRISRLTSMSTSHVLYLTYRPSIFVTY